jgi:RNA polymerase sigma-70 factor (sigma-E family)
MPRFVPTRFRLVRRLSTFCDRNCVWVVSAVLVGRRGGGLVRPKDEDEFRDFVTARWHALVRMAYLLTGDHGRAEDLVQASLEKVHRRWRRIERRDAPEAYVRRAIVNAAASSVRRKRVREVPLTPSADYAGPDPYPASESREVVWSALATLPPRMRAVLVLRYFEDLGEADVAQAMDCSIGTVKSQASRGLVRLRELLAADLTVPAAHTGAEGRDR